MSIPTAESEALENKLHEAEEVESDGHAEMDAEDLASPHRLHWRAWVYSLVCVTVVMFGAAREPWAIGLALILMGAAVVIAPPRVRVPRVPAFLLLALAVLPVVGLLPVGVFGGQESWRQVLETEWSITTYGTLSPEWRRTLEAWLFTLVAVVWFWSCLGQNFSDGGRRLVLRIFAIAIVPVLILTMADKLGWLEVPWWPRVEAAAASAERSGFGPFVNQNHSSSLFAWMSVLSAAAAVEAFKRGSRLWMLFAVTVIFILGCVLVNTSRAGVLLYFLGLTLWFATAAMKRGFLRKVVVSSALAIGIISLILVSGGSVSQRLRSQPLTEMVGSDLRMWLARQTLSAASDAPWAGRGLGVFNEVFPHIFTDPLPDTRTIHPESDVLWVLFEGGLLLLLPCIALLIWLVRSSGPWLSGKKSKKHTHDSRSARRVRRAFGIAAGLAIGHSIFDVPLHNLGYFTIFSLVIAQAVRGRYLTERIQPLLQWGFRGAGVLIALWGLLWLAFSAGFTEITTASGATTLHDRAVRAFAAGQRTEAMRLINRATELMPLHFRWYFLRAQFHVAMQHGTDAALTDFGRARALEPHYANFCFEEGSYWLHVDPTMALIAWREGIRRYPAGASNANFRYQSIVIEASAYPEVAAQLWSLADRPSHQLLFLTQTKQPETVRRCLQEFLKQYPGMVGLNPTQIRYFFHIWPKTSERQELIDYLKKYPQLQEYGWQVMAQDLASAGKFEDAFRLAAKYITPPSRSASLTAQDVPRLERAFILNPIDPLPGVELYYAQRAAGDLKSARRTLEKVMSMPKSPAFLPRELASLLVDLGDARGGWDIMQRLMADHQTDMAVTDDRPDVPDGFERPAAPPSRDAPNGIMSGWSY